MPKINLAYQFYDQRLQPVFKDELKEKPMLVRETLSDVCYFASLKTNQENYAKLHKLHLKIELSQEPEIELDNDEITIISNALKNNENMPSGSVGQINEILNGRDPWDLINGKS